ncbi:unnamed protein product [Thelazia callipaeda]|uniref:Ion_trans_2 domain-containing protein n=1 Tax=Thelazia callipaeda TaxID=103827 RepID=A0A0N5D1V2_THECL|nr:unnamed protein product [Thelazia callipaeda]
MIFSESYGDVACHTTGGRLMTVIYAVVGIPLMLITLSDLGKLLYEAVNEMVKMIRLAFTSFGYQSNISLKSSIQGSIDIAQLEMSSDMNQKRNIKGEINNYSGIEDDFGSQKPKFLLDAETIDEIDGKKMSTKFDDIQFINSDPPPRIPVLIAISITISWIFLCAALFKIWEYDWTYAESCYFMFISLMVLCFVFVIIGLSMVSMCINVIQLALEDFYIKILLKLVFEYQSKLSQGNNRVEASVGMMQMWGDNRAAKYLMPLLSKNKRLSLMNKVQKDAEARGIEVPQIFSDIDEELGMPKLFWKNRKESANVNSVEKALQRVQSMEQKLPKLVLRDIGVQAYLLHLDDKNEETSITAPLDAFVFTHPSFQHEATTVDVQCDEILPLYDMVQIKETEMKMNGTQTETIDTSDTEIQTNLHDFQDTPRQTEFHKQVETSLVGKISTAIQTVPMEKRKLSRVRRAKKRLKQTFRSSLEAQRRKVSQISTQSLQDFHVNKDSKTAGNKKWSETETLKWDPIDGMHAEKQRRVRDLKKFFETTVKEDHSSS